MSQPDSRTARTARTAIRQLDEAAINRIAAGEVIERPASVVKELVENALDANASNIAITFRDGGKALVRVTDDGDGIPAEELPLAIERHATSKIDGSDLLAIHTFGFRGEALASLGAAGRLSVTSRARGADAAEISVVGGRVGAVRPAALNCGTAVELRDLFHSTPARLKFLRSERSEGMAIADVARRLAMAHPSVGFEVAEQSGEAEGKDGKRVVFKADPATGDFFDALGERLGKIMGKDFVENAVRVDSTREGVRIYGLAGLPTNSRGNAIAQYLFVNGRPVRDRMLLGALRGAYGDLLPRGRHPAVALFFDCAPELVDVNVHPAKSEVRFRDSGVVRGLLVSSLKHALAGAGHRASTTVSDAALGAFRPEGAGSSDTRPAQGRSYLSNLSRQVHRPSSGALGVARDVQAPIAGDGADFPESAGHGRVVLGGDEVLGISGRVEGDGAYGSEAADGEALVGLPLGAARGQVHENYIIAQTTDGIVIVDQHAAHERLVYERLKAQAEATGVEAQALLIPEIVQLSADEARLILEHDEELRKLGLSVEPFGGDAIAVRETPALLGKADASSLVRDIVDELLELGESRALRDRLDAILSRIACHGSIRSGRVMRAEEMNALLRDMEATPHSGQCNHGRPTYVELKLSDIEKLFERA